MEYKKTKITLIAINMDMIRRGTNLANVSKSNEKILISDKAGATKATNNGPNIVPWLFAAPNFPIPAVLFSLEVISAT